MTLPAALFGTAVRLLRTAAGRRALQLALLVGGLFVAGFLCGAQAHAAEGTPVSPVNSVAGHEDAVRTVRTVTERIVIPVRDVARTASSTVAETRTKVPTLPAVPSAPAVPSPPSPPSVPLPELPGVSERLPVPASPAPPAPSTPESRPHRQDSTSPAAGKDDQARAETRTALPARPSATAYGPDLESATPQAPAHPATHHTTARGGAPEQHPAPTGDPDGVLGKQAADGTASRHGDAHAVTPGGRAPVRLLPGTAARVDAPRTRERHRDIPLFPG
ncbi:hypothetical protein ACIGXF_07815 [Streptomyces sp. NPDC053086]|uniref:hypothetical protein n=1 Tax=unclassified Streptomyces TaxID=2593676 RepID=UPI0036F672D2